LLPAVPRLRRASSGTSAGHGGDGAAVEGPTTVRGDLDPELDSPTRDDPVDGRRGDDLVADLRRVLHRLVGPLAGAARAATRKTTQDEEDTIDDHGSHCGCAPGVAFVGANVAALDRLARARVSSSEEA
jgi:hypothetical protein